MTFTASADARVSQDSPATNYGTTTTLQSDGGKGDAQIRYIRFTVKGTRDTIQDVKLRLFCTGNTMNGPAVYLADNNWIESGASGITWNKQPDLWSSEIDQRGAVASGTWVEYDVSSEVTGDGTYTFALVSDSAQGAAFSSREGSMPPQLTVTLTP